MSAIRSVLIARSAFGDQYEPAWARALGEAGVTCRIADAHASVGSGLLGRIQERLLRGPGIARAGRDLVAAVERDRPDVVLLYHGHHFGPGVLDRLRSLAFVTGYHNDDPTGPRSGMLRYRLLLRALPRYQGYHVYRECNVPEFIAAGVPRVKVLPAYYLPWIDRPREVSAEDVRRWGGDILFAGHVEPDGRLDCLASAARAGLDVRVLGDARFWRPALPADAPPGLRLLPAAYGETYRAALCAAKVCACFFSKWNRDAVTRRAFEIPACGAFLLAERTPAMQALYEEGKEAEYFASPDEFVEKARFYAAHDEARRRVAEAGRRRAETSGYDIHSRMRQWLEDVAAWRDEAAGA